MKNRSTCAHVWSCFMATPVTMMTRPMTLRSLLFSGSVLLVSTGEAAAATRSNTHRAHEVQPAAQPVVLSRNTETEPVGVTVSAARRPIRADEIGTALTVVTEQQIKLQQRRTLADILIRQPGLNLVQTGGMGGTSFIYMRGNDSNEVKVRLDGMDINDGSGASGAFDAGQFMTDGMGRIEILRGPQSGLYGADAMAGVIDITTAQGQGRFTPFVRVEGGSIGTFNQAFGARGSAGRFHYNVVLDHYRQVGFHSVPVYLENYYHANAEQRNRGNMNDNRGANIRLGYDITDTLDAALTARLIQDNYHNYGVYDMMQEACGTDGASCGGYATGIGRQVERSTQNEAVVRGTVHHAAFGGRFDHMLGLGYMAVRRTYTTLQNDTAGQALPQYDPTYYNASRIKLDWHGTADFRRYGSLLVGAEHFYDWFREADNVSGYPLAVTSKGMSTTAGYGQYQGNLMHILYGAANIRYDSNSLYGNHVTWRVAPAIHVPGTGTVIKASVGTGFHGPSFYQLYINNAYTQGNPNLKAERLLGYDVGVEQTLLHKALRFGATWYESHARNLIQGQYNASYVYTYYNVDRARMYGVEAFVDWKALDNLTFNLNYTWTHARDVTTGQALPRRPAHKFDFNVTWLPVKDLSLSGNLLYVSGWWDTAAVSPYGTTRAQDYVTIDLAATYRINRYVSVFARADNLLNRQYENPVGYLQPGRAGYGGFTLSY